MKGIRYKVPYILLAECKFFLSSTAELAISDDVGIAFFTQLSFVKNIGLQPVADFFVSFLLLQSQSCTQIVVFLGSFIYMGATLSPSCMWEKLCGPI